jgi:hypothetical protein
MEGGREREVKMSNNNDGTTIPLPMPYKMGRFDLSHR